MMFVKYDNNELELDIDIENNRIKTALMSSTPENRNY